MFKRKPENNNQSDGILDKTTICALSTTGSMFELISAAEYNTMKESSLPIIKLNRKENI